MRDRLDKTSPLLSHNAKCRVHAGAQLLPCRVDWYYVQEDKHCNLDGQAVLLESCWKSCHPPFSDNGNAGPCLLRMAGESAMLLHSVGLLALHLIGARMSH